MSHRSQPAWRHHICGLYYSFQPNAWQVKKTYLPLVELEAHATILATTSRTQLTQIFLNPSDEKGIKEVRYTFPLYDGVSVVGFTCHVGDRTIVGEVKEKEKAKAVFKEAVARGETAGLLEQLPDASDVFSTTVGNVPPGAKVMIKITYLGELQHDMEVDGIRYTIPNIICPRYGSYPGTLRTSDSTEACGKSISITVDAEMADGSFIQKIQSPSHPIAMTMGMTSIAPHAEPTMSKASASLTLGTSSLESDFVVQIIAKDTGVPKAVLENHPTIPNHRALMATLVPKFALPAEKPEIVFICDQSGSMRGGRNELAVQALKVFLRSLPVGVKFNICAFGSNYEFLWPQSATYSQKSLDEATQHVATLRADYGGTEMLGPLKETIERRYKDMPLEVMLLTDGEIWNQQDLFTYLNESVGQSKAPIRVFTLGIGNGVSHALIEGIAKAGNGFSQTVGEGEMMDTKVVRMLKGALSPHISDYTLEVKYGPSSEHEDEDFEIVEKIAHSLKVKLDLEKEVEPEVPIFLEFKKMLTLIADDNQKKPISLFDTSVDLDKDEAPVDDPTGEARYAHLPNIPVPKIIQAPQNIPALFAFNRTSIYLLLGPEAPSTTPKSVLLRGTSAHGPLELEIPIQILDVPGETVHQLAAKKAIFELEQGRGWLPEARDNEGILLKTRFEGKFSDMVEREAVRLGVQFQVGGKWCSFVAVESNQNKAQQKKRDLEEWEWLEDEEAETVVANKFSNFAQSVAQAQAQRQNQAAHVGGNPQTQDFGSFSGQSSSLMAMAQRSVSSNPFGSAGWQPGAAPTLFGSTFSVPGSGGGTRLPPVTLALARMSNTYGAPGTAAAPSGAVLFEGAPAQAAPSSSGLFGSRPAQPAPSGSALFGGAPAQSVPHTQAFSSGPTLFGNLHTTPAPSTSDAKALQDYQMGLMILHQDRPNRKFFTPVTSGMPQNMLTGQAIPNGAPPPPPPPSACPAAPVIASLLRPAKKRRSTPSTSHQFLHVAAEVDDSDDSDTDMGFMLVDDDVSSAIPTEQGRQAPKSPEISPFSPGYSPISPSYSPTSPGFAATSPQFAAASPQYSDARLARMDNTAARPATPPPPSITDAPALFLHHIIALQSFSGAWEWNAKLETVFKGLGISEALLRGLKTEKGEDMHQLATAVAVAVLEVKLEGLRGSWELVVEKARGWLDMEGREGIVERAVVLVRGL